MLLVLLHHAAPLTFGYHFSVSDSNGSSTFIMKSSSTAHLLDVSSLSFADLGFAIPFPRVASTVQPHFARAFTVSASAVKAPFGRRYSSSPSRPPVHSLFSVPSLVNLLNMDEGNHAARPWHWRLGKTAISRKKIREARNWIPPGIEFLYLCISFPLLLSEFQISKLC